MRITPNSRLQHSRQMRALRLLRTRPIDRRRIKRARRIIDLVHRSTTRQLGEAIRHFGRAVAVQAPAIRRLANSYRDTMERIAAVDIIYDHPPCQRIAARPMTPKEHLEAFRDNMLGINAE